MNKQTNKQIVIDLIKEEVEKQLNEGSNNYTQYDAEFLSDWRESINNLPGGASSEVKKAFNDAENIRLGMWVKVFGQPNSKWEVKKKGNKYVVVEK